MRFFLLALLTSGFLLAQDLPFDSLHLAYLAADSDSLRWEINREIFSYQTQVQADSALRYAERSYAMARRSGDSVQIGRSLDMLGRSAILKNELEQAQHYLIRAGKILRRQNAEEHLVEVESVMARVYIDLGDYENARRYLHRANDYYRQHPDNWRIVVPLIRFTLLFDRMGEPDSMIHYARQAVEVAEEHQVTRVLTMVRNNLASGLYAVGKLDEAEYHYRQAIELAKINDPSTLDHAAYGLASIFQDRGQPDSSLHYGLLTAEWAADYGDRENEAAGYEVAATSYAALGDYERAYDYLNRYRTTSDSVNAERHNQDLAQLNVQYETEQKEAQIARQNLLLAQERHRRNLLLLCVLPVLVLLVVTLLYFRQRQRAQKQHAQLELQLQRAEADKLRELDRLKSDFFANVSHELRTPLSLLVSPLQEMYDGTFTGNTRRYLGTMLRNGERLLRLVDQLLELARLESGTATLHPEPTDFTALVRANVAAFETRAIERSIYLRATYPQGSLPVRVDRDKVEKILVNLLANAFKFSPEGGRIEVRLRTESPTQPATVPICLQVSDTGSGIPEDQLPHIFERFFTGGANNHSAGSGIGLALTRELVELLDGSIEVDSQVGSGTTFTIRLPLQRVPAEALTAVSVVASASNGPLPAAPPSEAVTDNTGPLVLIVEDNPELQHYIRDQLQGQYRILTASDGQQGLELAREHVPDLVISDLVMPRLDGLQLCQSLKTHELTSHVPLILLTARAEREDRLTGLAHGADGYLTKPFDATELRLSVDNLLRRDRLLAEKFAAGRAPADPEAAVGLPATETAFLSRVAAAIEDRLDDSELGVAELAQQLGLSRSQLHRKLTALTGQSPSVFVRSLRLRHAYRLLEAGSGNVSEVAFLVGFANLPYFSRCFREQFGFPPSELRQKT